MEATEEKDSEERINSPSTSSIVRQRSVSSTASSHHSPHHPQNVNPLHLPEAATHSYLGNPLHELYSRSILYPNQKYDILIYPLPDIVLFPGETIPLRITNREFINKLGQLIELAKLGNQEIACHIGIIRLVESFRFTNTIEKIGTTVEIKSTHNNTTINDEELIITAKGRYRFQLLKLKRINGINVDNSFYIGEVMILGDYPKQSNHLFMKSCVNPFPLQYEKRFSPKALAKLAYYEFENILLWKGEVNTLKKWGPLNDRNDDEDDDRTEEGGEEGTEGEGKGRRGKVSPPAKSPSSSSKSPVAKKRRSSSPPVPSSSSAGISSSSPPPSSSSSMKSKSLHKLPSKDQLLLKPEQEQPQQSESEKTKDVILGAELDPVAFSFDLCANLPIPSSDLQALLSCQDVIDRLILAIELLKRNKQLKSISCSTCNQIIAKKGDIFNVPGADGCAGAYVNCHGAVHQTMTFRKLDRNAYIELSGSPSTQDSWFPGYAWTIVYCGRCYNHLGWRFTLVGDDTLTTQSRTNRNNNIRFPRPPTQSQTQRETHSLRNQSRSILSMLLSRHFPPETAAILASQLSTSMAGAITGPEGDDDEEEEEAGDDNGDEETAENSDENDEEEEEDNDEDEEEDDIHQYGGTSQRAGGQATADVPSDTSSHHHEEEIAAGNEDRIRSMMESSDVHSVAIPADDAETTTRQAIQGGDLLQDNDNDEEGDEDAKTEESDGEEEDENHSYYTAEMTSESSSDRYHRLHLDDDESQRREESAETQDEGNSRSNVVSTLEIPTNQVVQETAVSTSTSVSPHYSSHTGDSNITTTNPNDEEIDSESTQQQDPNSTHPDNNNNSVADVIIRSPSNNNNFFSNFFQQYVNFSRSPAVSSAPSTRSFLEDNTTESNNDNDGGDEEILEEDDGIVHEFW